MRGDFGGVFTMHESSKEQLRSVFFDIARWWRNLWGNSAGRAELSKFSPQELRQIALDSGVSPGDLRSLAGKWPNSADLLTRRMATFQLDPLTIARSQPAVSNDLNRLCSLCTSKGRCEHDLDWDRSNPKWREYCPNESTLSALSDHKTSTPINERNR